MDRRHRHRAFLGAVMLLALVGTARAQTSSPVVTPTPTAPTTATATATPWVQASSPPARPPVITIRVNKDGRYFFEKEKDALPADKLAERLHRLRDTQGDALRVVIRAESDTSYAAITTALDQVNGVGIKNVSFVVSPGSKPPGPTPTPQPPAAAVPSATPSTEEIARTMARKREEELAKPPAAPAVRPPRGEPPLPPDEREAYERNLTLWLALPPEERQALRGQATERIREETEKAYQNSGLNLNDDQREVFALRYRQERRRLEREIQEKATAERARRLPEIMERIKHEFAAAPPAVNPPKPTPTATSSPVK